MESWITVIVGGGKGVGGLSKKEKGLMNMDYSVVIVGGKEGIRVLNGNGKNTIKYLKIKKNKNLFLKEKKKCKS